MPTEILEDRTDSKEETQLVTFLLKDEEFGFNIMSVQEIIRLPKMAKVPRTPPYVEGIANLRGVVLPIVDVRTRFGMERTEETDRTRVLVVDIGGVKTGLRVDRVKQVTRVLRSDIEPPPPAIRGTTADYLEGVVKLDSGQRTTDHHGAERVPGLPNRCGSPQKRFICRDGQRCTRNRCSQFGRCRGYRSNGNVPDCEGGIRVPNGARARNPSRPNPEASSRCSGLRARCSDRPRPDSTHSGSAPAAAPALVSGGVCWRMPGNPRLLSGLVGNGSQSGKPDRSVRCGTPPRLDQLRKHFQPDPDGGLSKIRGLNEKLVKQLQTRATSEEITSTGAAVTSALAEFEREVAANIQEDQRIIVVDANGFVLGLVVDHVNEVLNVMRKLLDPPPMITSSGGMELEAVAKLEDGNRLIMLLDVAHLMRDQKLRDIQTGATSEAGATAHAAADETNDTPQELSEVQLVTFMLGGEEYGVPISQIQEIDRLSKITKVPKAARFVEGVTNLRGEVVPVLDTRKRFDLEVKDSDDRTRIMIVELGGVKTGLIVDSVREVLSLSKKDIAPPPQAIHSGIDQEFISGIGKVDSGKRMIVLLDVEKILSKGEQAELQVPA